MEGMAQGSVLGNVIDFMEHLGVYDVILPFLLVFTLVFAMLEKTKLFGTETVQGEEFPKKNLNAMVAFVVGFLVIASSRLVETITSISANMVVLLMAAIFFLLLVGTFFKPTKEGVSLEEHPTWKTTFMGIMFVGLVFIFLNAITTENGETWLEYIMDFLAKHWDNAAVGTLILIILVIFFIGWVTKEKEEKPKE